MNYGILPIIDILGTFAFAVSGALLAIEKKLDPFGVLVLSFVTAIGGGTLRDMMIGNLPVLWLRNEVTTVVIFGSAVFTMLFASRLKYFNSTLKIFDALGLGLFTIIGVEMGIVRDFSVGVCIALGTVTACFGGVIRDVLLNQVPMVFRKEIYALAGIIGAGLYVVLRNGGLDNDIAKVISIIVIFVIRLVAIRFGISLPTVRNISR